MAYFYRLYTICWSKQFLAADGFVGASTFWRAWYEDFYGVLGVFGTEFDRFFIARAIFRRRTDLAVYLICFGMAIGWYFGMEAKNDRI